MWNSIPLYTVQLDLNILIKIIYFIWQTKFQILKKLNSVMLTVEVTEDDVMLKRTGLDREE